MQWNPVLLCYVEICRQIIHEHKTNHYWKSEESLQNNKQMKCFTIYCSTHIFIPLYCIDGLVQDCSIVSPLLTHWRYCSFSLSHGYQCSVYPLLYIFLIFKIEFCQNPLVRLTSMGYVHISQDLWAVSTWFCLTSTRIPITNMEIPIISKWGWGCLLFLSQREREIKFIGLFGDRRHRGPYSPYKPCNHNLYIGIVIFPHIDNPQSTGYN